jgi:hypothetical protein
MSKLFRSNVEALQDKTRRRRLRSRPRLEPLEIRVVLSTFQVNTTLDTVAANLQTGTDALGHISLRSAIMATNALPGADTIFLANGLFRLTIAGTGEDNAAKGDLDISGDVTIQGRGHTGTIIDGNGLDRVFHVLSGTTSISQLTIQDGRCNVGAGLLNAGGKVTLSGVFVQNNIAIGADGAAGANGVPGVSADLRTSPDGVFSGVGRAAGFGLGSNGGDGAAGAAGLGGGIYNVSGSLLTNIGQVTIASNLATGGLGGQGGIRRGGIAGNGGEGGAGTFGSSEGICGVGGRGGLGGTGQGGGLFNTLGAKASFTGDPQNLTRETVALVQANRATGGLGGLGGAGGSGESGFGGNVFGSFATAQGDQAGAGLGGLGGAGGNGGIAEGDGFLNAGNLSFTAISVNPNTNQAIGGDGGTGGNGGDALGGLGGSGVHGGKGGQADSGSGGHGGNGGNGVGGGGFNAPTGVLLIAPRQGAVAGSAQAHGRSLFRSNSAVGGLQ